MKRNFPVSSPSAPPGEARGWALMFSTIYGGLSRGPAGGPPERLGRRKS